MIVRLFQNGIENNVVQRFDHFPTISFMVTKIIEAIAKIRK